MLSERIYRWLLLLYPGGHRREYGELMVQLFRDRMRRDGKGFGGLTVWRHVTVDLVGAAFEEHKEGTDMRKLTSIAIALAVLLVAGGIGTGVLLAQTRGEVTITIVQDENASTFTSEGADDVAGIMQQAVKEDAIDQQTADEIVQAFQGGGIPADAWQYNYEDDGGLEQALRQAVEEGYISQTTADAVGRYVGERLEEGPASFAGNVVVLEDAATTHLEIGPDADISIAPEAAEIALSFTGAGGGEVWHYDGAIDRVDEAVRQAVEDGLISSETAEIILGTLNVPNADS